MRSRNSRTATAVLAASLLLTLAGCGNDNEPSPEPDTAARSTTSGTGGSDESAEPTPSVEVTGPTINVDTFTITVPKASDVNGIYPWKTFKAYKRTGFVTRNDAGSITIIAGNYPSSHSVDLERDARLSAKHGATEPTPLKRIDNQVHDGVEYWVLTGRDDTEYITEIGGVRNSYTWNIAFHFPPDWPEADQWLQAMIDSIQWKTPTQ
ncbi:MAG: hypothetical protein L0H31_06210 [Nocardioidaceae bacterium]|nr:hypothetical protein [Nocardioidaceae bacterium]